MSQPASDEPDAVKAEDKVTPIRGEVVERAASLEIVQGQRWWTAPQKAALSSIGLAECPDADGMAFLHLCQATGLDPFRREIYLIGRKAKVNNQWTTRWTPQTGIDGFRHLAEESGDYGGRIGPQWTEDGERWFSIWPKSKGYPVAARCGVIRTDRPHRCRQCGGEPGGDAHGVEGSLRDGQHVFDDERVTWHVAHWDEYVPMEKRYEGSGDSRRDTGEEQPTSMWRKMPAGQLGKCAEAGAIRAAFPRRAAGLYEHSEMDAASQAAKAIEESERDKQRRELAARPWAAGPGGQQGVVLDGTVVSSSEPEIVVYDRAALLAELEDQARAASKTVAQYASRWVAAHRKNIEDATDAELEAFLASRRSAAAPPPAAAPETAAEPADPETPGDHGLTVHDVARGSDDPSGDDDDGDDREPGEGQEPLLEVEDLPNHPFVAADDDPARCDDGCGEPEDARIHQP